MVEDPGQSSHPQKNFSQNVNPNKKTAVESALEAVLGRPATKTSQENKGPKESDALTRERELRKAVSLSYLRQNPKIEKEKKAPTAEHIEELRKALKEAGADTESRPKEEISPKEVAKDPIKKDPVVENSDDKKELPEEMLKKVLGIE